MSQQTVITYHCPRCMRQLDVGISLTTRVTCSNCGADVRVPKHTVTEGWAACGWCAAVVIFTAAIFFGFWMPGYMAQWWTSTPDNWWGALIVSFFASVFLALLPGAAIYLLAYLLVRDEDE